MRRLILTISAILAPIAASACPDFGLWGEERHSVSARSLYTPSYADVVAGGDIDLRRCTHIDPYNWNGRMRGFVIRQPDFSISVSELGGFQIEFRTVSTCDTVLLINTAVGNWYYDDDDNVDSPGDAKIRLTRPRSNGIYDIWVGTFDRDNCDARIIIETF